MTEQPLRIGVSGLGRGFMLLLPTLAAHPGVKLVAAADPRPEARQQFARDFGGYTSENFFDVCQRKDVDAVYIASPHQFHRSHVETAAAHGKHALVEKPMALSIEDCDAMIESMKQAGCCLVVGHCHSFDSPYLETARLVADGAYGSVRMITAFNFTDFLYRPRRPEELQTEAGGGVIFSQAAHQVDVVRLLAGSPARSVKALTGNWDTSRPTEGAYGCLIDFENGAFANLTYSGYAHFDTDEWMRWTGELGQDRADEPYGKARQLLRQLDSQQDEIALKNKRTYGNGLSLSSVANSTASHNHFGQVIVSCDKADLRPTPHGIEVYAEEEKYTIPLAPPDIPRREVVDELIDAIEGVKPPKHSGEWGRATMDVCYGILESAESRTEVQLQHQRA